MPNPIDITLGARLRQHRTERGLTQTDMGKACGVTFQQVQKYETGANRVSVSRLVQIAKAMSMSPCQLIAGLDEDHDPA